MLLTAFLLISTIFLTVILLYYLKINKYKVHGIPGPQVVPLIGNGLIFGKDVVDYFSNLCKLHEEYGPIVRVFPIWMTPAILVNDADVIQTILSSSVHINKSHEYKILKPWLGTGLLISTGEKWHKRRKLLTPAFHFKILEEFIEVFQVESNTLIEKLQQRINCGGFDVHPLIKLCALDIICKTAMGSSINAQNQELNYVKAVREFLILAVRREFSVWKFFDSLYNFSFDKIRMRSVVKILHEFTDKIIRNRKQLLQNSFDSDYKKKIAFLDILLKASKEGAGLTHEDIREEVDTFTFEGHDTITAGLSFILYEIARHEDVQEKIVKEIKEVVGDHQGKFTYADYQSLSYLGAVIKEGLRLYPPVPFFMRELQEDIKIGNHLVPKGCSLTISAYSLHHQEKYFPSPDDFQPERFSKENTANQHPYSYIPFSAGPRNCIGQKFAMLEIKAIICRILMNFRLMPEPGHKLTLFCDSILKSDTGVYIRLEKR